MSAPAPWRFVRFGLLVTGKGEAVFLDKLFRSLMARGDCHFQVLRKVEQLRPRTSKKIPLLPPGGGRPLSSRDEEIAFVVRRGLETGYDYVILVDDLEHEFREQAEAVYQRYREPLDRILSPEQRRRVSVHFLANMLEAYYFADARAINAVLDTDLADHDGDVETIRHPKGELEARVHGFHEIDHGEQIIRELDVSRVLSHPERCACLRTLFGWCWRALRLPPGEEYRLADGRHFAVTRGQIDLLPPVTGE
jgi:hypothetical protein